MDIPTAQRQRAATDLHRSLFVHCSPHSLCQRLWRSGRTVRSAVVMSETLHEPLDHCKRFLIRETDRCLSLRQMGVARATRTYTRTRACMRTLAPCLRITRAHAGAHTRVHGRKPDISVRNKPPTVAKPTTDSDFAQDRISTGCTVLGCPETAERTTAALVRLCTNTRSTTYPHL